MSFSEAAEKYSEDGSAANQGDLGWLIQEILSLNLKKKWII